MRSLVFRRMSAVTLATFILFSPIVASSAQQPAPLRQPDTVPFEVATALVSAGGFAGEPQILVGSMPEWVANRIYVPPNARILGSAFLGTTVVAVLSLPSASDSVIPEFTRELLKRGWTNAPPPTPYGGGFRSAPPRADRTPTRVVLCGDQQIVSVGAARRGGVATDVTIRVSTAPGTGFCHPQPLPFGMAPSPFPTLFNPASAADARMNGDCSSNMYTGSGTNTTLRTDMTPEALLEHYGRQLQDSGWKSVADATTIVTRSWTRPDSAGISVEAALTVSTSTHGTTCRDVNLQIRKVQK